jgi:cytidylate kinase
MYRAVTLFALNEGFIKENKIDEKKLEQALKNIKLDFKEINGKNHIFLNDRDVESQIRSLEISSLTSIVSTLPFVREFLVSQQRQIGKEGGIVMDGRDIGTVVFPNADIKFFVTASPEIRAKRRYAELKQKGENITFDEVLENLKKRDLTDTTRKISPLKKAPDDIEIDNSNLNREQQLELALEFINKKLKTNEKN